MRRSIPFVLFFVLACGSTSPTPDEPPAGSEEHVVERSAPSDTEPSDSTSVEGDHDLVGAEATSAPEETDERDMLVVFIEVRSPVHRERVIRALIEAGHEALPEEADDEVVLIIERSAFESLFHARLGSVTTGASASDRTVTITTLDSYRPPPRIRRWVRSVYLDPQR